MTEYLQYFIGIGPDLAAKIIAKLKHTPISIEEARNMLQSIYADLPIATKEDLTYNPIRKIPREIIANIELKIIKITKRIRFAGSYLRGKQTSSDVDLVMIGDANMLATIRAKFNQEYMPKYKMLEPYSAGNSKASFLIKVNKQYIKADIFFATKQTFIYAYLYATGSGNFNKIMRHHAKRQGYLLNQYGLYKDNKQVADIHKEADIFKVLHIKYLEPKDR
jgi:DNA polymerase/3'-5' exonuclease PolX